MASKITDRIAAYMEEFPKDEGLSLYHCEFVKEGPDRYLRVYIDVDHNFILSDKIRPVYSSVSNSRANHQKKV